MNHYPNIPNVPAGQVQPHLISVDEQRTIAAGLRPKSRVVARARAAAHFPKILGVFVATAVLFWYLYRMMGFLAMNISTSFLTWAPRSEICSEPCEGPPFTCGPFADPFPWHEGPYLGYCSFIQGACEKQLDFVKMPAYLYQMLRLYLDVSVQLACIGCAAFVVMFFTFTPPPGFGRELWRDIKFFLCPEICLVVTSQARGGWQQVLRGVNPAQADLPTDHHDRRHFEGYNVPCHYEASVNAPWMLRYHVEVRWPGSHLYFHAPDFPLWRVPREWVDNLRNPTTGHLNVPSFCKMASPRTVAAALATADPQKTYEVACLGLISRYSDDQSATYVQSYNNGANMSYQYCRMAFGSYLEENAFLNAAEGGFRR